MTNLIIKFPSIWIDSLSLGKLRLKLGTLKEGTYLPLGNYKGLTPIVIWISTSLTSKSTEPLAVI